MIVHQPQPSADPAPECGPLAHIPLFAPLRIDDQRELVALMRVEHYEPNQTIFWFGDVGDSLFLVNRGSVSVKIPTDEGKETAISRLSAGGFFGELGLLDGGPRTATVRAVEPTDVFVLGREQFHTFLRHNPGAAIEMLTVMGQRSRVGLQAMRSMKNPNEEFEKGQTTLWQHVSDTVASVAASQWFILFHVCWFGGWVVWNLLGRIKILPSEWTWDPFPFGLLTMMVSLEAIFLSIFVMVSQNRQSEKDRLRVDIDHQVNVKAQAEIMGIARHLERIEAMMRSRDAEQRKEP